MFNVGPAKHVAMNLDGLFDAEEGGRSSNYVWKGMAECPSKDLHSRGSLKLPVWYQIVTGERTFEPSALRGNAAPGTPNRQKRSPSR